VAYIEVKGLKEFQQAVRKARDKDLNKRLGQANKAVGDLVIQRLSPKPDPAAVGVGAGSSVRPSASKREVLLRVGGVHRSSGQHTKKQPWGKRRTVRPGTHTPPRPNIQGTADDHFDDIGNEWMTATMQALGPAFADARIRSL